MHTQFSRACRCVFILPYDNFLQRPQFRGVTLGDVLQWVWVTRERVTLLFLHWPYAFVLSLMCDRNLHLLNGYVHGVPHTTPNKCCGR